MRVCLLNDSFPPIIDGVANTVVNYANILTQEKLASVIVGTPRYPEVDYTGYPFEVVPYNSVDARALIEGYRVGNPIAVKAVGNIVDFAPDIIHTHCPASSTFMARMLRHELDGVPVVFTYHTKFDVDIAKAVRSELIQKETLNAIVSNISACDEVWVVSQGAGENLRSLGYEGEYRIMTNGVDFPKGRASEEAVRTATEGYDLPQGVPLYLFVGRLMKYKGLPIILEALRLLKDREEDFRMVFVGSGADEEEMKETVREYGLEEKVFFTGPIRDREVLRAWNTRADLFLFPSTYDTNGIVVREAAACGLASVLIEGSCAAEGITHGRNGYLIEENGEAMAALLTEVGKNLDALHAVGEQAMEEIYVSWDQSVKTAYARYAEIIEDKKSGISGRKRQFTDLALAMSAEMMEGAQRAFAAPKNIRNNMNDVTENLQDLRSDVAMNIAEFREGMMENIADFREDVRDGIRSRRDNLKDMRSRHREELRSTKEDFCRIRDNVKENVMETLEKHLGEK